MSQYNLIQIPNNIFLRNLKIILLNVWVLNLQSLIFECTIWNQYFCSQNDTNLRLRYVNHEICVYKSRSNLYSRENYNFHINGHTFIFLCSRIIHIQKTKFFIISVSKFKRYFWELPFSYHIGDTEISYHILSRIIFYHMVSEKCYCSMLSPIPELNCIEDTQLILSRWQWQRRKSF
jgi:hypothetical protein